MDPTRSEAWYGKGNALYKLGRFEAATDAYSAAANVKWSNEDQ
jgi:Flp pilus assembly protein TadD